MTLEQIQFWQMVGTLAAAFGTLAATVIALRIGNRQNKISSQLGNIQNSIEIIGLQGTAQRMVNDQVTTINILRIINVGSRTIYCYRYCSNGRWNENDHQVLPPFSIAKTEAQIELLTNDSFAIQYQYSDPESNYWMNEIIGKFEFNSWNIRTKPKVKISI